MKFYRVNNDDQGVAIKNEGDFFTSHLEANIDYSFDYADNTIKLKIDGQWFNDTDLDDLIEFLKFAKTQLNA